MPQVVQAASPTISSISNRTINEDGSTGSIPFTVMDSDTNATVLVVTRSSSNTTLVPTGNIVLSGNSTNRSVTVTPAANRNGSATITLTVRDPENNTDTETFTVTVSEQPDSPTFTGNVPAAGGNIADNQTINLVSGLTVADIDDNRPDPESFTVVVTLTFSGQILGRFQGMETNVVTLTGGLSSINSQLDGLVFSPFANVIPSGMTDTFDLSARVTDADNRSVNRNFTVTMNGVNDDPSFAVSVVPPIISENQSARPFSASISDPDVGENLTLSIGLVNPSDVDFGVLDPTPTTFMGTPATLMDDILGVSYNPIPNSVSGNQVVRFRFTLDDGNGGVVTLTNQITIRGVNEAPDIVGVPLGLTRINSEETNYFPFSTVTVVDADDGGQQLVSVRVTTDVSGKGTFVLHPSRWTGNPPNPFTNVINGVYTNATTLVSTNLTPAELTEALRAVTFVPDVQAIPVGQTEALSFTLTVTDSAGETRVNNGTRVAITGTAGAPSIVGVPTPDQQPKPLSPLPPVLPFDGLSVQDDSGSVSLTVVIDNPDKGTLVLTNTTLASTVMFAAPTNTPGSYSLTGSPLELSTALSNIHYQVNPDFVFLPNQPGNTTFSLTVVDDVLNSNTEVLQVQFINLPRNFLVTVTGDETNSLTHPNMAERGRPKIGTLRRALEDSMDNDVVTIALEDYPAVIRLTRPLVITDNVAIKGPGANQVTISGDSNANDQPDTQIFQVGAWVALEGLTLSHGISDSTGGAIYVGPNGRLIMRYCTVAHSMATWWGGGLDIDGGSLQMENCLVLNNTTDETLGFGGGGISIYSDLDSSIINTTFSGNEQLALSGTSGGALYVENQDPVTEMNVYVTHCTFLENNDFADRGTSIGANVFGSNVRVRNSIFADGWGRNLEVIGAGRIISEGGNLSDDSTTTIFTQGGLPNAATLLDQSTDMIDTDPLLEPLDLRLTPMPGYPPQLGSPVIGKAQGSRVGVDQNGSLRDSQPDSGALEFEPVGRVVLNEIHFDPDTASSEEDFLEFYVLRDSMPVNLSLFTIWVDGTNVFRFPVDTVIQPGRGIVIADDLITAGDPPANPTTVLTNPATALNLGTRGIVELRTPEPNSATALIMGYVGVFANLSSPTNNVEYGTNSLTLAPQFSGYAMVPHRLVKSPPTGGVDTSQLGALSSPGLDTGNTAFGSPNAKPIANGDSFLVSEDLLTRLPVLDNDLDADGLDQLFIIDVNPSPTQNLVMVLTNSVENALVAIDPASPAMQGTSILYDPRATTNLQALPVGGRITDRFYYSIIDYGFGPITDFEGMVGDPATIIVSPAHRLSTNEMITISGSATTDYNGSFAVTPLDDDRFSIPIAFTNNPAAKGSWVTDGPRMATDRDEAGVVLTVLGANDPPIPVNDVVDNGEETILRILGDAALAGTSTAFDTDDQYTQVPALFSGNLLGNDLDPDSDDNFSSLRIIGVVDEIQAITNYAGIPGESPVVISSPGHGLDDGTEILLAGYLGHPSYNGFHAITLIDEDHFSIPVLYVDNNPVKGSWTLLDDTTRLQAVSREGAAVTLEIRADRIETSLVYDPLVSTNINALSEGIVGSDFFHYVVEDSHGAIGVARIEVRNTGVNDLPVPGQDPESLGLLNPLVNLDRSLTDVIGSLSVDYYLPAVSTTPGLVDALAEFDENGTIIPVLLTDLFVTDEDTALTNATSVLLANDTDVDSSDILSISAVGSISQRGASVTLAGGFVIYNPLPSAELNALARGEPILDSYEVTVSDGQGGEVTSRVAVLVIGANDTPFAQTDDVVAFEDTVLVFDPTTHPLTNAALHDIAYDVNGRVPDNTLVLVPVTNVTTTVPGAFFNIIGNEIFYDPTQSPEFDALAQDQPYPVEDTFMYTVRDSSLIFANDDLFKVAADGAGYELNVLSNDRNFNGAGGALSVKELGTPNRGGTATLRASGNVIYSPEINFVGDEIFTYLVEDELGNADKGLVVVRVTVNQLNGNLQANDDYFSAARGEASALDVLANDNILPAGPDGLTITQLIVGPDQGGAVLIEEGGLSYTPDPAFAGTYPYQETFSYEISGGLTARAVAVVTVTVVDRFGALPVRNDAFSVEAGSADNLFSVLVNDNILPGAVDDLSIMDITQPAHGVASINGEGDGVLYTPAFGYVGNDMLTYVVTDGVGGTGTGRVDIAVGMLSTGNDFFTVPTNQVSVLDVLANDLNLQTFASSLTIVSVMPSNASIGLLEPGPGGTNLVFTPIPGQTDEVDFIYTVVDGSGGVADGMVTILPVGQGVIANPDFFTVEQDSSQTFLQVLRNDVALPDEGRVRTIAAIGTGLNGPNRGGTVIINATGDGLIYTPAPGFFGEETFTYTMTDSVNFDSTVVAVTVAGGSLFANNDAYTVFYEIPAGTSSSLMISDILDLPVLVSDLNDTNNEVSVFLVSEFTTETTDLLAAYPGSGSDPSLESALLQDLNLIIQGDEVIYDPQRFTNVVLSVLSQEWLGRNPEEVDVPRLNRLLLQDAYPGRLARMTAMSFNLGVLDNDRILPDVGGLLTITGVGIDDTNSFNAPDMQGLVQISGDGTSLIYTPRDEFVGFDYNEQFTYEITDGSAIRAEGVVLVNVQRRTTTRDLDTHDDDYTVAGDSTGNELNVLANDHVKPGSAEGWTITSVTDPNFGGVAIIAGTSIQYTPQPGFTGTESFTYFVSDGLGGTGSGLITVKVSDLPVCPDLFTAMSGGPATLLDVLNNDAVRPDDTSEFNLVDAVNPSQGGSVAVIDGSVLYSPDTNYAGPFPYIETFNYIIEDDSMMTVSGLVAVHVHETGSDRTNGIVNVTVVGVNDPPTISGTVAGQRVYQNGSVHLFSSVTVSEVDMQGDEPVWVRAIINNPTNGFFRSLGAFVDMGNGVYMLGTSSNRLHTTIVSEALRALEFVPTPGSRVQPNTPEVTQFTIEVEDGLAPTVSDDTTTVISLHPFVQKVSPPNGGTDDEFGFAVATTRDMIVVGVPFDNNGIRNSGSVNIFTRNATNTDQWDFAQQLSADDATEADQFGYAVATSGDYIVAGARNAGFNGRNSGATYIFMRDAADTNTWVQVQKVGPQDGSGNDQFGYSVALEEDLMAIGSHRDDDNGDASGSVYMFRVNASGTNANRFDFVDKITASDGSGNDQFGYSVALRSNVLAVGAPFANPNSTKSGAAYVFEPDAFNADQWTESRRLLPPNPDVDDQFGLDVDVGIDLVVVGAPMKRENSERRGAIYLYERGVGPTFWEFADEIVAPDAADRDEFGFSISLDEETGNQGPVIFVSARKDDDNGQKSGSAYAFARDRETPDNWGLVEKFVPPDGDQFDQFGYAVALSQHTAVVGARRDEPDTGERFGSTYVFRLKFNNAPLPIMPIADQSTGTNGLFTFIIPDMTFADPDVVETKTLSASLVDGSPLPAWLSFDAGTRTFSGTPMATNDYAIAVISTDMEGLTFTNSFLLSVLPFNSGGTNGSPGPVVLSIANNPLANSVTVSYIRPLGADETKYHLLVAPDAVTWSNGDGLIVTETVTPIDASTEDVAYELDKASFPAGSQFFQVLVDP